MTFTLRLTKSLQVTSPKASQKFHGAISAEKKKITLFPVRWYTLRIAADLKLNIN